jgi:signal peptidase II
MRRYVKIAWLIFWGMFLLFLDFFTKAYIYHILPFQQTITGERFFNAPVFYDFFGIDFCISLAVNKGAAWGFFSDFQIPLLILRTLLILAMFIYLFFMNQNRRMEMPMIFILSGALGNVIDFFLYGFVIDFFHFNLWGYHFPIFNLADTCITIGVAWLFLITCFNRKYVRA